MDAKLAAENVSADMLLQVHDELIFEVPNGEEDKAIKFIKRVMEQAAEPALKLTVPLQVDAHAANNWDEAH
ncbi:DNA polymerase, partial [bacterium]|nr:DNA polymerase [bacterium]